MQENDEAITGSELATLSDEQFQQRIQNISVYARVSPEDKIRVVKAWQKQNAIVSMTGDGVNDAPALKAARVGIAMGGIGSDIAIDAADIVPVSYTHLDVYKRQSVLWGR